MPFNTNNQTQSTATVLSTSTGQLGRSYGTLSGPGDNVDYYTFKTTAISNLNVSLEDVTGTNNSKSNVNLKVFAKGTGNVLGAELTTAAITSTGTLSEAYVRNDLPVGEYIIQVTTDLPLTDSVNTVDYTLKTTVSSDSASNTPIWRQTGTDNVSFWQMNGVAPNASTNYPPGLAGFEIVGTGDFNGDKTDDVLWRQTGVASSLLVMWLMGSDNSLLSANILSFFGATPLGLDAGIKVVGVKDLDGDKKADIIFQGADDTAFMWKMDGPTIVVAKAYQGLTGYKIAGFADLNGDGNQDVLFRNNVGGQGLVVGWLMNGVDQLANGTGFISTGLTANYEIKGFKNLNKTVGGSATSPLADTRDDLLIYDNNTGQIVTWLMNGLSIQSAAPVGGPIPKSYYIATVEDFDGDGNGDIFWRNPTGADTPAPAGGKVGIWLFEGNGVKANGAKFSSLPIGADYVPTIFKDFNNDGKSDVMWRNNSPNPADPYQNSVAIWLMDGTDPKEFDFAYDPAKPPKGFFADPAGLYKFDSRFDVQYVLQSQLTKRTQSVAGNTTNTAFNLGILNGTGNYQDSVVGAAKDLFKFKLDTSSKVDVLLSNAFGSTAAVNGSFRLLRETAVSPTGQSTTVALTAAEQAGTLATGVYYVEISATTPTAPAALYNLKITGTPQVVNLRGTALQVSGVGDSVGAPDESNQNPAVRLLDVTATSKPKAKAQIAYTIENTEAGTATNVEAEFFLSRNPQVDTADTSKTISLGKQTLKVTPTGANITVTGNSTVSGVVEVELPPGDNSFWTNNNATYYLAMKTDPTNTVTESNENDNFKRGLNIDIDPVFIRNVQIPDLVGATLTGPASIGRNSGTATINYSVRNAGKKSTGTAPLGVSYYLFKSPAGEPITFTPGADSTTRVELSSVSTSNGFLPLDIAGETTTASKAVTLNLPEVSSSFWADLTPGTGLYFGIVYDGGGSLAESDESNNYAQVDASGNIVLGKDIVAVQFSG
jgi:hypothetical protein